MKDSSFSLSVAEPDLTAMRARVEPIGAGRVLDAVSRHLVALAVLTALRASDEIASRTAAALDDGASPVAIREALYQCAPYAGFPAVQSALCRADAVFAARGVALPLPTQTTVTDETRFADGLAVQKSLFGDAIDAMHAASPEDQKTLVVEHLTAFCFGDVYTRRGLDLKMRELLTFSVISALGGCEPQLKSHVQGNVAAGNGRRELLEALEVCLPLMGFPRTLNALGCVNAVLPN